MKDINWELKIGSFTAKGVVTKEVLDNVKSRWVFFSIIKQAFKNFSDKYNKNKKKI